MSPDTFSCSISHKRITRGLQGVPTGYGGFEGVTGDYKGLQWVTGVPGGYECVSECK